MKYLKSFSLLESVTFDDLDIMIQDIKDLGFRVDKKFGWCSTNYTPYEYGVKASKVPFKGSVKFCKIEIFGGMSKNDEDGTMTQNVDLQILSDFLVEVNSSIDRISDIGKTFTHIHIEGVGQSNDPSIRLNIWVRTNESTDESPKDVVIDLTREYFKQNGYKIPPEYNSPNADPDYFFLDVFPESTYSNLKSNYEDLSEKADGIFNEIKKIVGKKANIRNGGLFNGYSLKIHIDP